MKLVHVECLPDEALVKQLGCKQVIHHSGKSRVFNKLKKEKNQFAMVDEDPASAKGAYEKSLTLIKEEEGIIMYRDNSGNTIIVLKGKLEDWILMVCKKYKVDIAEFGLPANRNELHERIHLQLRGFEKLIQHLKQNKNKAILMLADYLHN